MTMAYAIAHTQGFSLREDTKASYSGAPCTPIFS